MSRFGRTRTIEGGGKTVTFADGTDAKRSDRPEAAVRFTVRSDEPLARVTVWRAARVDGQFEAVEAVTVAGETTLNELARTVA